MFLVIDDSVLIAHIWSVWSFILILPPFDSFIPFHSFDLPFYHSGGSFYHSMIIHFFDTFWLFIIRSYHSFDCSFLHNLILPFDFHFLLMEFHSHSTFDIHFDLCDATTTILWWNADAFHFWAGGIPPGDSTFWSFRVPFILGGTSLFTFYLFWYKLPLLGIPPAVGCSWWVFYILILFISHSHIHFWWMGISFHIPDFLFHWRW